MSLMLDMGDHLYQAFAMLLLEYLWMIVADAIPQKLKNTDNSFEYSQEFNEKLLNVIANVNKNSVPHCT